MHEITTKPASVAVLGIFGKGNIGNNATLTVFLRVLAAAQPTCVATIVCPHFATVATSHGCNAVPLHPRTPARSQSALVRYALSPFKVLFDLMAIRRLTSRVDRLIIPGTGILDDYAMPSWHFAYLLVLWCLAARLSRKRVEFVDVGVGPIKRPMNRLFMRLALRLATYRSYRDEASRAYAGTLGATIGNERVLPDLAFLHPLPPGGTTAQATPAPLIIGLGVMSYFGWWARRDDGGRAIYASYVQKIAAFATTQLRRGHNLRFLIGKDSDKEAVADVLRLIPADLHSACCSSSVINSFADLLTEIVRTDVVVATRFHNIVAALLTGRPAISISYADKNDVLLRDIGLDGFSQFIEKLDLELLERQLDRLVARRNELSQLVGQHVATYRVTLQCYMSEYFERSTADAVLAPTSVSV